MSTLNAEADGVDLENVTLSELFDRAWKLQQDMMKSCTDETTQAYMLNRKKAIEMLEKCDFMLGELHLFSSNESIDEVSTSELRY